MAALFALAIFSRMFTTRADQLAWCDGISADGQACYAYWWGLQAARKHLDDLGAPYPAMPPFDESEYEPMPEIEFNPDDEFHVDDEELLSSKSTSFSI